ncbi:glycosyltransferase family 4 protein [Pseudoalteromonas denitrificans]|uniref:Glycosyltransferase involved in cell wall bisynthesis n=1 Tax=Pseudoalteromonas denitrificans DSM 6059 TaxID=1123010 RepID=A0A1I1SE90_9GAMM|nr:glycosyltransferase [Pseudoalteromonas denitrificans]SFD44787.1 Glycosyltransferase involved in cell wall bisynthesis [Pseudoalteromonas denitrificans DSM 6059]
MNPSLVNISESNQYALITSNMYRPSIGGIENSLYHLAQEYKALGYKVIIVTSDINNLNTDLPDYEIENGVEVYRYRACSGQGVLGFIKQVRNAFNLYKKLLNKYKPSVVVCRYHFNLVLLKLAGCNNIAYLIPGVVKNETQASMAQGLSGFSKLRAKLSFSFHVKLQNLALKQANKLFVFSQNMLSQVSELTNRQDIKVTKPGVSLSRFYPLSRTEKLIARKSLGHDTERHVFLCIGRHVKAKGFETAIRAIVDANNSNLELWLLGDGPLTDYFESLIIKLKCQKQVKLIGRQQCPEQYYKVADTFVMSSIYEPLGQTILEALATGLPIVAAPSTSNVVTASNEIIDTEHNFFSHEHSVHAFSHEFKKASQLSDDEYKKISEFNRKQAEIRFSWAALANDLIAETSNSTFKVESR